MSRQGTVICCLLLPVKDRWNLILDDKFQAHNPVPSWKQHLYGGWLCNSLLWKTTSCYPTLPVQSPHIPSCYFSPQQQAGRQLTTLSSLPCLVLAAATCTFRLWLPLMLASTHARLPVSLALPWQRPFWQWVSRDDVQPERSLRPDCSSHHASH